EEAFEAALNVRGLVEGATVKAAFESFQPEIPDVGGTQLTTIEEESEGPGLAGDRELEPTEVEGLDDRKRSAKEKRKQKKSKRPSLDESAEADLASVAADAKLEPQVSQTSADTFPSAASTEERVLAEPT